MSALRTWTLALGMLMTIAWPQEIRAQGAETVIEWNRILQATLTTPGANPPTVFVTRSLAMLHVAIFDALNSIDYVYTPYAVRVEAEADASPDAAAAQAGHDILTALFPAQRPIFDAALADTMNRLPGAAAQRGARVGAAAARAILEVRAFDGWNRRPPQYLLPERPGNWQPAPPQVVPATFTHYPDVQGFVIGSARQFLVQPPPALTSEGYTADFNMVKALGAANSQTRTEDQTLVARLFASVGTTTPLQSYWNNICRELVRSRGLTALNAARLFALFNVTFHDALLTSFTGKYLYGFWRPVTAIRGAALDGNPATEADPTWTALIPNPPYPTYPGNMACIGSALTRVLGRVFGRDDIPFSVRWEAADGPGWTRTYQAFHHLAEEAARSRIYGGIHFNFDTVASFGVCIPLADYIYDNTFRPRFPPER